jgi:hypothetical protein
LHGEEEVENVRELGVDVCREKLSAFVGVAEEESEDRERRAEDLEGNVPLTFYYLEKGIMVRLWVELRDWF